MEVAVFQFKYEGMTASRTTPVRRKQTIRAQHHSGRRLARRHASLRLYLPSSVLNTMQGVINVPPVSFVDVEH